MQQMSALLERSRHESTFARLSGMLLVCESQLARLSRLVEHPLDVSRIHESRLSLRLEEMDLAAVAREVVAHPKEQLEVAAVSGARCARAPAGPVGQAAPEQVLMNLLTNGEVRRGSPSARLAHHGEQVAERGGPRWAFPRVPGLASSSASSAASANYGGLGLGLHHPTNRGVGMHGGRVWVERRGGALASSSSCPSGLTSAGLPPAGARRRARPTLSRLRPRHSLG